MAGEAGKRDMMAVGPDGKGLKTRVGDVLEAVKAPLAAANLATAAVSFTLALELSGKPLGAALRAAAFMIPGCFLTAAGSCAINNYIDRDIDRLMERTRERPTAAGRLSPSSVLALGAVLIALGIAGLFAASPWSALFGFLGSFVYLGPYSLWTKRRTPLAVAVGAVSGGIPVLIGWSAAGVGFSREVLGLFLILGVWQAAHFLPLSLKRDGEFALAGIPTVSGRRGPGFSRLLVIASAAALFPLSLSLFSLGPIFLSISAALSLGWVAIGFLPRSRVSGTEADQAWAARMYACSLAYLPLLYAAAVACGFPAR